jgi:hypothetical protein
MGYGMMIINGDLGGMCEETIVAFYTALSHHLSGETKETHRKA